MSIRTDQVQLRIDFITDEAKAMAGAIRDTKKYTAAIAEAEKAIKAAENALKATNITETKRAELLKKIADNERIVADNLRNITEAGKKAEKIDLKNLAPQQLIERAKQLDAAIRRIPASAPEFARLQAELRAVNTQLGEYRRGSSAAPTGGGFGQIGALVGRLGPVAAGVGAVIAALTPAVKAASDLEQLTISFETFLGSAEKAKQVIGDLKQFEASTPFEAEQVNQAGRALLAFGFSTEELIPTLRAVGDVAAGTGKDFNELVLIYGKAKAQGLIQGEELNQLAEAGIPIYAELGKVLGVAESKIRKMGEEGKISFNDLEKVFQNLTGEGGRFNNLMEKQSKSLGGLYSTLKSQVMGFLAQVGTAIAPLLKELLTVFINIGEHVGKVVIPVLKGFVDRQMALLRGFKSLSEAVGGFFKNFTLEKMEGFANNFGILGRGLGGLINRYRTARDEQAKVAAEYDARAKAEDERDERQLSGEEKAAIAEKERLRAETASEARQKEAEKAEAVREKAEARAKAAFDRALALVESDTKARELDAEARNITGETTEAQHQAELSRIHEEGLIQRIEAYRTFGKLQTNEAQATRNELLRIETARAERAASSPLAALPGASLPTSVQQQDSGTDAAIGFAQAGNTGAQGALKAKFEAALIAEGEYQLRSLDLKKALIDEEIAILRAATEPQVREIEKREKDKAKVEADIAEQRIENERRTQEMRARLTEAGSQGIQAALELGITLLGKDEAARKKHANIIKAFETGQVVAQGITEVQKIFAKNAALPGGTLLSIAESIPAALRTTAAVVKIQRQKFAGGGDTGSGTGRADETGHVPVGIVHANEYVVPRWMRRLPEVRTSLDWMESIRQRGYAQGGLVSTSTTPTFNASVSPAPQTSVNMERLERTAEMLLKAAQAMPTEVKARVVYTEIEDTGDLLNQVRGESQI